MIQQRIARLQKVMQQENIHAAIYGCGSGYQYLTGEGQSWRFRSDEIPAGTGLLVPSEGDACKLGKEEDSLPAGLMSDTIAVGGRPDVALWKEIRSAFADADLTSGDALLSPLRRIKDAEEIRRLRKAGDLTDKAVLASLPALKEGTTMKEMQLEMEHQAGLLGASGTSFDIVAGFISASGEPTGSIFSYDIDEGLLPETTVFFDVGFVVDGYCSDWGRTLFLGNPGEEAEAYSSLQSAVVNTVNGIIPGETKVCDLFPAIEKFLDADGFGDYIRARLPSKSVGHQIGIEVHENPWLEPKNSDLLVPGMVFCMEPKLWKDGTFYMRVEDMIHVAKEGAEFLTNFDREMFAL